MKSIFFRYLFMSVLIISSSFMILGVIFIYASSSTLSASRIEELSLLSSEVAYEAAIAIGMGNNQIDPSLVRSLRIAGNSLGARILICGSDRKIIASSDNPAQSHDGDYFYDDIFDAAMSSMSALVTKKQDVTDSGLTTVLARPITLGGTTVGLVVVSSSDKLDRQLLSAFVRIFFFVSAIVLFAAFCTTYATSSTMARPLKDMASCAHCFAHGDFSIRVNRWIFRDDEIGELACAFNAMADALEKEEELRRGFIANVSHELRTPMTTIAGFVGGLLDGTVEPSKQTETLSIVRNEIWRLSRMVASMTELARLQSGQMDIHSKAFDVCELAMRIILGLESKIEDKALHVSIRLPEEETLTVYADPDLITQVFTNLLDNAIKFSDYQGEITLSINRRSGKGQIGIRNTGPCIPKEDLPYVFDRFHKADRSRSRDRTGLGLGLYLTRSILNAHNEDIHVKSEQGTTEFTFSLPEAGRHLF